MLVRLALPRPDVDFALTVDGKRTLHLPSGEDFEDRVKRAFGRRLSGGLLPVDRRSGEYRVTGFVSDPDAAELACGLFL